MPYLVDSVVAELNRIDVSVRRLVHPVVFVRRDLTGTLREVLTGSDPDEMPTDALAESWMHVSIVPERIRQVEQRLLAVLTDVREVVEDTQRMTGTAYTLADELNTAPPLLPTEEVADGAALLRWLAHGHFTFLGYRRSELVWESTDRQEHGGAPALRAVLASGLGVLPDELALRIGAGLNTCRLLDVVEVAESAGPDAEQVAPLYYALSAHLDIDQMLSSVNELERADRWHALARLALRDDLYAALRDITLDALHTGDAGVDPGTTIERWEQANSSRLSRARVILGEISDAGSLDLATLPVAVRALTRL